VRTKSARTERADEWLIAARPGREAEIAGKLQDALAGLFASATDVTEVVCTNSAPVPADYPKLRVLSVAPALAEAISRIHNGESVSSLFDH